MARESSITPEQVAAAADTIRAAGGKPTARSVREALGGGSMATVLKHLQAWQGTQTRASEAVDDTLDPSIARAISNAIAGRVQEATADATARLADLQGEAAAVIAECERLAGELEAQAAELVKFHDLATELGGRVQQLESSASQDAAELVAERAAAEAARVSLAKAELRLEAVPRIESELVQVRGELAQARADAATYHEAAAVAAARQAAAEAAQAKAENQAEAASTRAAAAEHALQGERVAVLAGQARLEAVARELAESATKAQAVAKQAGEEAAELRGQLAAAKAVKGPAAAAVATVLEEQLPPQGKSKVRLHRITIRCGERTLERIAKSEALRLRAIETALETANEINTGSLDWDGAQAWADVA